MIRALAKPVLVLIWMAAVLVAYAAMYKEDMAHALSPTGLAEDAYRIIAILLIVGFIHAFLWHVITDFKAWWEDRNYLADCDYQLQKHQVSVEAWMTQLEIWKEEDNESRV